MLENKNASQNVFYIITFGLCLTILSRGNLFWCRIKIIMRYFRALEKGYLIFYLVTDQIIVSPLIHYVIT